MSTMQENNHSRLIWEITPATWPGFITFLATLPLALWLPLGWGEENSPIEWLQVVIVAATMLLAWIAATRGAGSRPTRRLWLWSTSAWVLIIGRELSWGRVFYPLPGRTTQFYALRDLWFGPVVYPLIAVIFIGTVIGIVAGGLHRELWNWLTTGKFPAYDVMILIAAAILADVSEQRIDKFLGERCELFEELFELAAYWSMLSLTVNLGFHSRFQPRNTELPGEKHSQQA